METDSAPEDNATRSAFVSKGLFLKEGNSLSIHLINSDVSSWFFISKFQVILSSNLSVTYRMRKQ